MAMKEKVVGTKGKSAVRENSFGSPPPSIKMTKGDMDTFGYKVRNGIWPGKPTSVDQKTGFPEGFDKMNKRK